MNVERYLHPIFLISMVLGIIGAIMGVIVWGKDPYAGFLWLLISVPIALFSLGGSLRVKMAKDIETKAGIGIQHSWWVLSFGFSGLILFPAPFFVQHGGAGYAYSMTVISLIWVILGIIGIYKPHADTGVSITI
ncbi:MAG: hypothetical protein J7J42_05335 [Thermoplasmata archaeon]|nr:hypothetical protein [Thermoplasmata archaeon]